MMERVMVRSARSLWHLKYYLILSAGKRTLGWKQGGSRAMGRPALRRTVGGKPSLA